MASVQPVRQPDRWPEERPDSASRREAAAPRRDSGEARDPGAGFERRPLPLSGRELLPMVIILMLISGLTAVTILYLTAFGKVTAQGARKAQIERQISELQQVNTGLVGEVARLQRRDRLEREARRLGLQPFTPEQTQKFELPAGALDAPSAAPAADSAAARPVPRRTSVRPAAARTALRPAEAN